MKKVVSMMGLSFLLVGCSTSPFTTNSDKQYLHSHNGPNLTIPPSLVSSNISSFYVLPSQNQNPNVDVTPPVAKYPG